MKVDIPGKINKYTICWTAVGAKFLLKNTNFCHHLPLPFKGTFSFFSRISNGELMKNQRSSVRINQKFRNFQFKTLLFTVN